MKICYVYEVTNVEGTSFTKLKTIYDSADGGPFNRQKYAGIFNEVVNKISRKYAVHTIII